MCYCPPSVLLHFHLILTFIDASRASVSQIYRDGELIAGLSSCDNDIADSCINISQKKGGENHSSSACVPGLSIKGKRRQLKVIK
jgi:hypothetical protein